MTVEEIRAALFYVDKDIPVRVLRVGDNPFAGGIPISRAVQVSTLDNAGESDPCIFLLLDEVEK